MKDLLAAVFPVLPARKVNLAPLDPWDLLVKRAFLVFPARLESRVLLVFLDVEFPVHLETVVILVFLVLMVLKVKRAIKANLENLVYVAQRVDEVQQAQEVIVETRVPMVWMDVRVSREILGQMVLPVPMENLDVVESTDARERRVSKVFLASVVIPGIWVLLVMKGLWVRWDHLERM